MSQRDWLVDAETSTIETALQSLLVSLRRLPVAERIEPLNQIRRALHEVSPFSAEPVDCVIWVPAEKLRANDYNPNTVAPPEMQLLARSIGEDGYTQPIVSWVNGDGFEVVDGFHRHRVGRENQEIRERVRGHLPLTVVNADRVDRGDRIAATIRHNRARGKHQVEAMSDIVMELRRRNWSPEKIGKELGMDPDEVLRLTQITGMAELFSNEEFSKSWSLDAVDDAATDESLLAELET
jgi:ParB-like chromosome segregation protein Spo0J